MIKDLIVDMEPFFAHYRSVLPFFVNDEPLPEDLERASCGPLVKHLAHLAMHAAQAGATVEQWRAWVRTHASEASPTLLAEAEECMHSAGLWPWHG